MRNVLWIIGVLLLLAGGTFALQGIGVLPGSYMTGQMMWFWIGSGLVLVGVVLFLAGFRLQRRGS